MAVSTKGLTVADLLERFGPMPAGRIRTNPPPGTATEQDVIDIEEQESRLCELVDGVLVEKTVGIYESYLALRLGHFLSGFVERHRLGIVVGADGMMRLAADLVRIPDVSFVSWNQLARAPRSSGADCRSGARAGNRGDQSRATRLRKWNENSRTSWPPACSSCGTCCRSRKRSTRTRLTGMTF